MVLRAIDSMGRELYAPGRWAADYNRSDKRGFVADCRRAKSLVELLGQIRDVQDPEA
jgi:hypothetical protein